ncbi:MAG: helix-turn-helix transcriptional regulator [Putridiphycobacter sp.]|nr:helix-turn-helix transcriptional regulator [Putridiphycobacter sp.]
MKNSRFLKEVKRVKGYEQYMNATYFDDGLSGVLNQLVYAIDFRSMTYIYLSKNVKEVFGLEYDYIIENGPMSIYRHTPEEDTALLDRHILKAITQTAYAEKDNEPENLRFAYNFRLKTDTGQLKCLLNRFSILIYGEKGIPFVVVGTMTDVSHLYDKRELFCEGTRFHGDGTSSIILHKVFPLQNGKAKPNLTKKEIEVLKLVMDGYISKEIAEKTNRSIETIHTHRKNILKKMKCNNITEAVLMAKEANWF